MTALATPQGTDEPAEGWRADIRFAPGGRFRWGTTIWCAEGDVVGTLIRRLARRHGVVNATLAIDGTANPDSALGIGDRVPRRILYIRLRRPPLAPLVQCNMDVNGLGWRRVPVLVPVYDTVHVLDHIVLALSGTGAVPDFWFRYPPWRLGDGDGQLAQPRRLRRDVPFILQVIEPLDIQLTWTFQVQRRDWRPVLFQRDDESNDDEDFDIELPLMFWGAQRDLAPQFFDRFSRSPSRCHRLER